MSMNAEIMKNFIIDKINKESESAAEANKKFGDAILEYICDNISIVYGWSAALTATPFTSDPVVSFNATVSGTGILTPSESFEKMLEKLTVLIKALTISVPSGFTVAPLVFNPTGVLVIVMAKENTQDFAMTNFCTQFIAGIKSSFINPAPCAGTHGTFSGATTSMVIS